MVFSKEWVLEIFISILFIVVDSRLSVRNYSFKAHEIDIVDWIVNYYIKLTDLY